MIVKCGLCGAVARYPDYKSTLICPNCGFAVKHSENHEKCPFCKGIGVSKFNRRRNGWKIECSNLGVCPVKMRTLYCDTERDAWELWDTRVV